MTPEQAILSAYRPHDRRTENRLLGPDGLTRMEILQAFYGVEGGREFLVNFLAEHATPGESAPLECIDRTKCMADEHALCCPSVKRRTEAEESSVPRGAENCASRLDCPSASHLRDCPWWTDPHHEVPVEVGTEHESNASEAQVWERRVPGTDVAEVRVHLAVDDQGRVELHEAVVAQLLADAGWERAS
ncbi:hypothetical protein [Nocardioides lijunqiniae]|uniref:hypothetical protein n=1 Tax=Nocardioides lijunqiniae TaxID=2760832 RepID=UPI001878B969|nr:hypothetical protein [Nocardioides lijunqiniae]